MKEKASITISSEVLKAIDQLAGSKSSRSAVIERVLRQYLIQQRRAAANCRDLEILNRSADRLNSEAADVLDYQVGPE